MKLSFKYNSIGKTLMLCFLALIWLSGVLQASSTYKENMGGFGKYPPELFKDYSLQQVQEEQVLKQLEKIDSLKANDNNYELGLAYIDLATLYRLRLEHGKARKSLFRSLRIMRDINNELGIAHAKSGIGMFFWRRSKYDSAIVFMQEAISIYKDLNNAENYAIDLNSLGTAYYQIGMYDKALSCYIESNRLRIELDDYPGISKTYINIGMIYRDLSYFDMAKGYFNKGLKWAKISEVSDVIGYSYNSIGSLHEKEGNLDSALYYYLKSIHSYTDKGYNIAIMNQTNVGRVYLAKKEYEKAEEYLGSALEYAILIDDRSAQAEIYKSLSMLNLGKGDSERAISYIGLSLKISEDTGKKELMKDNYKILVDIYESKGDRTKALNYYKKYHESYTTLFNQEVGKKISVLEEQKEMEKQRLELSIKELELKGKEFSRKLSTAIAIGFLLLTLALYYFNRKIKKSNTELKEKNSQIEEQKRELDLHNQHLKRLSVTQNKLFSILAHDLRNPFHSMLGYSELLIEDFNNLSRSEQLDYIKTIKNALSSTYDLLVNLLFWTRANTGSLERRPEKFDLNQLIRTTLNISESQARRKNLRIDLNILNDTLHVIGDRNMIEIVIRNLITNAIKFTPRKGKIHIETSIKGAAAVCNIKDEGIGIDSESVDSIFDFEHRNTQNGTEGERGSGLGLILCKEFVELNNGKISVESEPGKGSLFTFNLPLADNK